MLFKIFFSLLNKKKLRIMTTTSKIDTYNNDLYLATCLMI